MYGDEECVNVCSVGVFEMQDEKAVPANEDDTPRMRELCRGLPLGRDHDNGNLSAPGTGIKPGEQETFGPPPLFLVPVVEKPPC